jgi:hypothetical protein
MRIRGFLALLALVAACFVTAPAARSADDPLAFDDPGMHFRPPDGWERLPTPPLPPGSTMGINETAPVAAWVFHSGKIDQRVITVNIRSYDGDLDALERSHESDLRNATDGLFVDKHDLTKLSNGMPAYWLRTSEGSEIGKYYRRYEWVVFDGHRSILVTYLGRQGDFSDKDAKEAMASLYVVVYPRDRR